MNFPVKKLKFFAFYAVISICTLLSLGAEDKFSPQKIVCLSPSGAEILCALDSFDKIKARTDYCDYPEKLKSLPSVGGFDGKTLSIETILSYSPDFIYGSQGMH
ncbi:MAG TPA: iron ABC transporter, partial [Treponema sp.]|nr:iron ABC transporter [Treponema sp.]